MVAKKIASTSEEDRLTDSNIEKVIGMLNPSDPEIKPCTKKDACAILGIAYNTTRLATIISKYEEKIKYEKEKRAEKKGTPVSHSEVIYAIQAYIDGETLDAISKTLYRSTSTIKDILVSNSVTFRPVSHDYFKPELIPDAATRERFAIGEIVYSAQYNVNAEICKEELSPVYGYVYRVWLKGDQQQFAFVPAYELASLEHLRKIGVNV